MKCVEDSFSNKDTEDEDNSILGEDYEYWQDGGFMYTPSVIINDVKYNGDMAPSYVFEAICASYKDKPLECNATSFLTPMQDDKVSFNWFLVVIFILVIFNVILAFFCIRKNKSQVESQVSLAMGKYSKFSGSES